ncbi:UPF0280 family protein [Mesorhizobium sp. BAC0120]|uniref:UPF0280 family protein n=1 Tax=Mesorhizobium sp. BAC0120 TaxID=3090670 RepID=UPI00298D0118|nr:UPF0280 family protein [Mesorhizobium sp. BAC0120]MDW6026501.1 UPF0280 family protein [Mesorhizobium sp. BAC0120]
MNGPQIAWLADGRRLHLNHGPIDLIIETFGRDAERHAAHDAAVARFQSILAELVEELVDLRKPAGAAPRHFKGSTARRMERAVQKFHPEFITPMAAVAGSVADEIMAAMTSAAELDKAYVNDGGDIAIHLTGDASIGAAVAGTGHGFDDRLAIHALDPVRGIATSGWRGRSFSFGIADAVTVLAEDAAAADAAATLIANAVDLPGHPAVKREPANELAPDSDLGARLVTTGVGPLGAGEVRQALERGAAEAENYRRRGLIHSAAVFLAGETVVAGNVTRLGPRTVVQNTMRKQRLEMPVSEGTVSTSGLLASEVLR